MPEPPRLEILQPVDARRRARAQGRASRRRAARGRHRPHGGAQLPPRAARRPCSTSRASPSCATGRRDDGRVRVGAGVTYTRLIDELGERLPGLAIASRTVGSLQIRNRGTVGGNLATASPAGDGLPPLYTSDADGRAGLGARHAPRAGRRVRDRPQAHLPGRRRADRRVRRRRRRRPAAVRQGRHAQRDGDRRLLGQPRAVAGARAGSRRASAPRARRRCARPRPRRSSPACSTSTTLWDAAARRSPTARWSASASWSAQAARPIDDVRGTAAYRRHAVGVLARRTLRWAWEARGMTLQPDRQRRAREIDGAWGGESLLYALRERLGLPGAKNACEQGECGSCSVYLDGTLVCSCLVLAAQADGRDVVTVEGLARRGRAARGPAGVRRRGRGPVRLLHAGADRRQPRPAAARPAAERRRHPRGARRQPVPLHGLREDHRRRAARRRAAGRRAGMSAPVVAPPGRVVAGGHRHQPASGSTAIPKVARRVRVLVGHERRRDAVGRDAAQPAPARADPRARHERRGRRARRARRAHPRRRARAQDVRARARRPARAGLGATCASRASRSRSSPPTIPRRRATPPTRSGSSTTCSSRSPTPRPRCGRTRRRCTRAATSCAACGSSTATRRAPRRRRRDAASTRSGCRTRRSSGPESGLAVPDGAGGVELHIATQWLHVDRDQVALSPRPAARARAVDARRRRRRVRRPRGPLDADPRVHARAAHRPPGEDGLQRARSRSSATCTGTRAGCATSTARRGTGRLVFVRARIVLDGGAYASSSTAVCSNAACFAAGPYAVPNARADRVRRLHEQPAVRRDARLRRGPGRVRARGADGQARRRSSAWTRSRCGCATRSRPATGCRPARSCPSPRRSRSCSSASATCRCPPPGDGAARPARAAGRRRQHHARGGRPARRRLRRRDQERRLLGGLRRLLDRARARLRSTPTGRSSRSTRPRPRSARACETVQAQIARDRAGDRARRRAARRHRRRARRARRRRRARPT